MKIRIWSISSLPLLSGPLSPGEVLPIKDQSMSHIELFNLLLGIIIDINYYRIISVKYQYLNLFNCITACKQMSSNSLKKVTYKLFT